MYQEEIADLTAAHLRSHIKAYIDAVGLIYPDTIKMQYPKSVETANLVGGVYNAKPNEMPAIAIDIISVEFAANTTEGLWLYNYDGHIAEVISGGSEDTVNRIIKRHQQACETFVNDHLHFHQVEDQLTSPLGQPFTIMEFGFSGSAFSGAEEVTEKQNRKTWIAGYRIDVNWLVSQQGPGDHA